MLISAAFCILLIFWVIFLVPETKGVGIEEMDKLFGGSQGEADMNRMVAIRQSLGVAFDSPDKAGARYLDAGVAQIEHA